MSIAATPACLVLATVLSMAASAVPASAAAEQMPSMPDESTPDAAGSERPIGEEPAASSEESHEAETADEGPFVVLFAGAGYLTDLRQTGTLSFNARVDFAVAGDLYIGASGQFATVGRFGELGDSHAAYLAGFLGPVASYRARLTPWFHLTPSVGLLAVVSLDDLDFESGRVPSHSPFALDIGLQAAFDLSGFLIGIESSLLVLGYEHESNFTGETKSVVSAPLLLRLVLGAAF
jgi:hypothetical protein